MEPVRRSGAECTVLLKKDGAFPLEQPGRLVLSDEVTTAGGNLFMPGSKGDYERILKAVRSGKLSRRQLEENASCVMETVRRLKEEK